MDKELKVGIVGIGRWGKNYIRTILDMEHVKCKWICARKESSIQNTLEQFKEQNIQSTTEYSELLSDRNLDAIIVSSPGSTHYELAKKALMSKKNVLVEKPCCLNLHDMENLIKLSKRVGKILMIGYLQLYNQAVVRLKEDIKKGILGKVRYVRYSQGGNGPIRSDISALWEFFPHYVSILNSILQNQFLSLQAYGASFVKNGVDDIVTVNISLSQGVWATGIATWLNPDKQMQIIVAGTKGYAVFDDCASEKLKYYSIGNPKFQIQETADDKPLTLQLQDFFNCIRTNKKPVSNNNIAMQVTKILEAAEISMRTGKRVHLENH